MKFVIKITERSGAPSKNTFIANGDDAMKALKTLLKNKHFSEYYGHIIGDVTIDIDHLNEDYTKRQSE